MSTDNEVSVVREILSGKKLSELKFQDKLEIKTGEKESVFLACRYTLDGKRVV